jgi:hypothetical protein
LEVAREYLEWMCKSAAKRIKKLFGCFNKQPFLPLMCHSRSAIRLRQLANGGGGSGNPDLLMFMLSDFNFESKRKYKRRILISFFHDKVKKLYLRYFL